jgi:hypothetical protein
VTRQPWSSTRSAPSPTWLVSSASSRTTLREEPLDGITRITTTTTTATRASATTRRPRSTTGPPRRSDSDVPPRSRPPTPPTPTGSAADVPSRRICPPWRGSTTPTRSSHRRRHRTVSQHALTGSGTATSGHGTTAGSGVMPTDVLFGAGVQLTAAVVLARRSATVRVRWSRAAARPASTLRLQCRYGSQRDHYRAGPPT